MSAWNTIYATQMPQEAAQPQVATGATLPGSPVTMSGPSPSSNAPTVSLLGIVVVLVVIRLMVEHGIKAGA